VQLNYIVVIWLANDLHNVCINVNVCNNPRSTCFCWPVNHLLWSCQIRRTLSMTILTDALQLTTVYIGEFGNLHYNSGVKYLSKCHYLSIFLTTLYFDWVSKIVATFTILTRFLNKYVLIFTPVHLWWTITHFWDLRLLVTTPPTQLEDQGLHVFLEDAGKQSEC